MPHAPTPTPRALRAAQRRAPLSAHPSAHPSAHLSALLSALLATSALTALPACDDGETPATPTGGAATPPGGGAATPPGGGAATPPGGGAATPPGGGAATPPGGGAATPPGGGATPPPGGGATPPTGGGFVPPMDEAGRCFQECLSLLSCEPTPAEGCGFEAQAALAARCELGCAGAEAAAIRAAAAGGCANASALVGAVGLSCVDESACEGVTCAAGEGCAGGTCAAWSCAPDSYDAAGNDARASAASLPFAPAALAGLTLCERDEDWYALDLPAGSSLRVDVAFDHAEADIDAALYFDDEETPAVTSASSSDNERLVALPAEGNRRVYVRLSVYGGEDELGEGAAPAPGRYALYLSTDLPAAICRSSSQCPEGDICNAAGVCVPPPPCASNDDCFGGVCDAASGRCVQCLTSEDCFGGVCDTSANSCVGCLADGDCESGAVCSPETRSCVQCLSDAQCPDGTCSDNNRCIPNACRDMFEPNEQQSAATPLAAMGGAIEARGLYICGDEDWFSLSLPGGPALITLTFSDAAGDIDMTLLNEAGEELYSRVSTSDNELLGLPNAVAGLYYLRVYGVGQTVNTYDLRVDLAPPGQLCAESSDCMTDCNRETAQCYPEGYCRTSQECLAANPNSSCDREQNICVTCTPDALEPNNTPMQATPAERAVGAQLNTCGEGDFYAVEVSAGKTLTARLTFVHASGDVDMRLYAPDGDTILDSSVSSTDNEEIVYMAAQGGVHFLQVYGYAGANNTYALSVTQQ